MTLTNVTLANNSAGNKGGGIRREGGTASLKNTIVANNTATGGDPNCTGTITSAGYNLDSGNSCLFTGTGDKINTNPLLGALQDNGGPTFTHALTTTSPAIDTGTSTGRRPLTNGELPGLSTVTATVRLFSISVLTRPDSWG